MAALLLLAKEERAEKLHEYMSAKIKTIHVPLADPRPLGVVFS
jgi:hypothetical protein